MHYLRYVCLPFQTFSDDFSYSYAAVNKVSTDTVRRAVPLR